MYNVGLRCFNMLTGEICWHAIASEINNEMCESSLWKWQQWRAIHLRHLWLKEIRRSNSYFLVLLRNILVSSWVRIKSCSVSEKALTFLHVDPIFEEANFKELNLRLKYLTRLSQVRKWSGKSIFKVLESQGFYFESGKIDILGNVRKNWIITPRMDERNGCKGRLEAASILHINFFVYLVREILFLSGKVSQVNFLNWGLC